MKCPVCDNVNSTLECPKCGFDSSRDHGKHPTFGPLGKLQSVSALRQERVRKQKEPAKERDLLPVPEPTLDPVDPPRRKKPWLLAAAAAAILILGIGIGAGLGGGKPEPTEPGESVQLQEPVVMTTAPPETTQPEETVDHEPWRNNILRSDEVRDVDSDGMIFLDDARETPVLGSNYRRNEIRSVIFLDTLVGMPEDAWDVSEYGNGTVMAWVKPNDAEYDLYIAGEGGVSAGSSCSGLFMGYELARSFDFNGAFHTDGARNMSYMFSDCDVLESLDLSSFDTSNVQDMSWMFYFCEGLESLDLSSFDTSNVQDMSLMFSFCEGLESLDLSSFDTARVQNMSCMFSECTQLKSLDLSNFNTTRVQEMNLMFALCESLTELDLSSFNTANVLDTTDMFEECPAAADWAHLLK